MKRSWIKPTGKIGKRWIKFRKQWLKDNPPINLFYTCGICGRPVHKDDVVLDHIQPRSYRPDLRFEATNIQPAHYWCNKEKGGSHA